MGPTPREIRLEKLNVSPILYCNLRARGGSTAAACTSFFFHKFRESHISTLLCKVSSSAQHFPPVPPAPMGHPRPPGADRSRSGFIQGQRAPVVLLSRPSTRSERGNHGPPWFVARLLTKISTTNYLELWESRFESSGPIGFSTVKYSKWWI